MIGHLGSRVSALLDGRLPQADEERAWEHVHLCHPCRDAVEREGWVKTRLAQLSHDHSASSHSLRESLLSPSFAAGVPMGLPVGETAASQPALRTRHLVALSGSALGMAVVGVIALGAAPANAPQMDRRGPVTSIVPPSASADTRPVPVAPSVPSSTPSATTSVRLSVVREKIAP
ncbi:hypothetical protein [Nocardioides gilvus]|uniref:hypothetical protein n=1 Tax=Nocardioides gilvus TaxID=1735589 RepID=UPI000D74A57F|nr:hypothetical protein [Nocardioides gilvus]